MSIPYISIIFIIVIFIFLLIGLSKGLFRSILSFLKKIIGAIGGFFTAKFLTGPIFKSDVGRGISNSLVNYFVSKGGIYAESFTVERITEKLNNSLLPAKLVNAILNLIERLGLQDGTVGFSMGEVLTYIIIWAVLFVLVYIIVRVIVNGVASAFKKASENSKSLKFIDRVLGGLLFTFIGVLVVDALCLVIGMILPIEGSLATWLVNNMHLNDDTFSFGKFLYNNNLLVYLWNLLLDLLLN